MFSYVVITPSFSRHLTHFCTLLSPWRSQRELELPLSPTISGFPSRGRLSQDDIDRFNSNEESRLLAILRVSLQSFLSWSIRSTESAYFFSSSIRAVRAWFRSSTAWSRSSFSSSIMRFQRSSLSSWMWSVTAAAYGERSKRFVCARSTATRTGSWLILLFKKACEKFRKKILLRIYMNSSSAGYLYNYIGCITRLRVAEVHQCIRIRKTIIRDFSIKPTGRHAARAYCLVFTFAVCVFYVLDTF